MCSLIPNIPSVKRQDSGIFVQSLACRFCGRGFPFGLFLLHRAAVRPFTEKQIKLIETFRARDINNQNNATKQEGQQQGSFNSIFKTLATMSENTGKGMSPGDLMKTTTQVLQARRQYMQQNPDATEAPGDIQVHNGHTYMFG